jgi:hypothetical protein
MREPSPIKINILSVASPNSTMETSNTLYIEAVVLKSPTILDIHIGGG